jgi:ATP/maltotriose-dependent transcriptional regulator MalT/DNA-binding SARP family transcriptional activator
MSDALVRTTAGSAIAEQVSGRPAGPVVVERPALERRLDEVLQRRLATVVAGGGYGKTTLVQTWARRHRVSWHTVAPADRDAGTLARKVADALLIESPDVDLTGMRTGVAGETDDPNRAGRLAGYLCGAAADCIRDDLVLVLDDVHEIAEGSEAARFLAELSRQAPEQLHLVLVSRSEPPLRIARLRAQGQVVDITGRQLAFNVDEVESLLASALDDEARAIAAPDVLHDATGGWPAAVRLAVEALRSASEEGRERVLANLSRPEGPMFSWLTEEVLANEPPAVGQLLRTVAPLERFTGELAEERGVPGARELVASLERRGLLIVPHRGKPGWFTLHPLVRAVAEDVATETDHAAVLAGAADWLEAEGEVRDALACRRRVGDWHGVARLVVDHGAELILAGAAAEVVTAVGELPENLRTEEIALLEVDAHHARGNSREALACLDRLIPPEGPTPPRYAWRAGLVHLHRGELDRALADFENACDDGERQDQAQLLAWECSLRAGRGEFELCRSLADRAVTAAEAAGDDRALSSAYVAKSLAQAFENDPHTQRVDLDLAMRHAHRAGDVVAVTHVHLYRGAAHYLRGEYREALADLDAGVRLTDAAGTGPNRTLIVALRGHTLLRLGRIEEAKRDAEAARRLVREQGASSAAYPFVLLAEVHRECGDHDLAVAAYEEAVLVGETSGEQTDTVAARAGLAGLLCASDPARAEALIEQALRRRGSAAYTHALLAGAWVAFAVGKVEVAHRRVEEAAAVARRRHDRSGLAAVLELRAALAADDGRRHVLLEEAGSVWRDLGDPLNSARVDLALARLSRDVGDDGTARECAGRALACFRELGLRRRAASADEFLRSLERRNRKPVEVTTLGGFAVTVAGNPLDVRAWQSRKARDLLKILASRRGRPVHREVLIELLWPDDDPGRGSSRLSVALSTLRAVLDPGKNHESDDFVSSDGAAVWVCLDRVAVDVESFLADAETGLALRSAGRTAEARERLVSADAAYTGDFLEEEAYADWPAPLREEARLAYVAVARGLAEEKADAGEHDAAVRHLLGILEHDPYDESAHLAIAGAFEAAGRHGEARRAYQGYCARMEELGVEPAMFPAPSRQSATNETPVT